SAIFTASSASFISHDARIPFRYSNTFGIMQASLPSALTQWNCLLLHEAKSARKADEILIKK
ncbi:MAG: hypothetical protein K2L45_08705, partial [Muribaculaceae bacterium]|nr:hypothetical protein [Muribaculaceae bacterium]